MAQVQVVTTMEVSITKSKFGDAEMKTTTTFTITLLFAFGNLGAGIMNLSIHEVGNILVGFILILVSGFIFSIAMLEYKELSTSHFFSSGGIDTK